MRKTEQSDIKLQAAELLKRPYARVLMIEPDGVTAEIMEFPGCVAYGTTSSEALANLDSVAFDWIIAALEQGQNIPEPMNVVDYSGKLVLRMPKGLHRRAAIQADREGVSLNQFIVTSLAEAVGERARVVSTPAPAPQVNMTTNANAFYVGIFNVSGMYAGRTYTTGIAHQNSSTFTPYTTVSAHQVLPSIPPSITG